ncbi:hypothetical protein PCANC_10695 [Puccinia coronata f. sp. avenae]|nr:hypothetical protein PCANC_15847 [Puccinia coronata f. sp. avenae]PLW48980.1 hypothetical protein PCANC_10695 [Puccinia coronata f. sp. avenae]
MLGYWRYQLVELSLFCFLWQAHCPIPLADGNTISCSVISSASNIDKKEYTRLGVDDVKARVKQISEEELKSYLATIPEFYQHRSTIFKDLGESIGHSNILGRTGLN